MNSKQKLIDLINQKLIDRYLEEKRKYYKTILPEVDFKCVHFFVVGEKKDVPSALGTHRCACMFCGENYFKHGPDMVLLLRRMPPHTHAWDLCPNGTYRCIARGCNNPVLDQICFN